MEIFDVKIERFDKKLPNTPFYHEYIVKDSVSYSSKDLDERIIEYVKRILSEDCYKVSIISKIRLTGHKKYLIEV